MGLGGMGGVRRNRRVRRQIVVQYPIGGTVSIRGCSRISQISHWLILVAFGYNWTSTIAKMTIILLYCDSLQQPSKI